MMTTVPTDGVLLSSGYFMPMIGLGTWQSEDEKETDQAIEAAIDSGYRHIDTAYVYKNEHFIGRTLKRLFESGKVKRSDLFIVTKLPSNGHREENVEYFCKKSLAALQLDFVDLYLIHTPISVVKTDDDDNFMPMKDGTLHSDLEVDLNKTWKAMEALVKKGLVRSIGLSNFNSKQIKNIYDNASIKPSNLQVECHAYLPQFKLQEFCKSLNISFTAYAPIGSPGLPAWAKEKYAVPIDDKIPKLIADPKVESIAKVYKKSPAQVLLRYLVERGIIVIPKSTSVKRIKENIDIFDFSLTDDEMADLKALDRGYRYFEFDFCAGWKEHPNYPYAEPF